MTLYLAGLLTLPALGALLWVLGYVYGELAHLLRSRGWTWEVKTDRRPHAIPAWRLEKEVWFERQRGPVFTGHWYRVAPNDRPCVNRWLGIGSAEGRSLVIFKKRVLEHE